MSLIQQRRDTAANWTAADPTLAAGEFGVETDTGKVKVGDGHTAWTALGYVTDQSEIGNLDASKITSGTLNAARLPDLSGTYAAVTEPVAAAEQARAEAAEALLLPKSQVGAANGAAALDSGGHVPVGQVPDLSGSYASLTKANAAPIAMQAAGDTQPSVVISPTDRSVTLGNGSQTPDARLSRQPSGVGVGAGTPLGPPLGTITATLGAAGLLTGVYQYAYTEFFNGETTLSTASSPVTAAGQQINLAVPFLRRGGGARTIYRTKAGGSTFYLLHRDDGGNDYYRSTYIDNTPDSGLGAAAPTVDGSSLMNFIAGPSVKFIATGPAQGQQPADLTILTGEPNTSGAFTIDAYGPMLVRTVIGDSYQSTKTQRPDGTWQGNHFTAYSVSNAIGAPGAANAVFVVAGMGGKVTIAPDQDVPALNIQPQVPNATGSPTVVIGNAAGSTQMLMQVTNNGSGVAFYLRAPGATNDLINAAGSGTGVFRVANDGSLQMTAGSWSSMNYLKVLTGLVIPSTATAPPTLNANGQMIVDNAGQLWFRDGSGNRYKLAGTAA